MFQGKRYAEIVVGETFQSAMTVTETHIVLGAGLIGGFNPVHVNQVFAEAAGLGGRILHGSMTSAIMSAVIGSYFHGTAGAYLEHTCRFRSAVKPGDTLQTRWTISGKEDKPGRNGGIASLKGVCHNQNEVLVAEAEAKVLVGNS